MKIDLSALDAVQAAQLAAFARVNNCTEEEAVAKLLVLSLDRAIGKDMPKGIKKDLPVLKKRH